MALSPCLSYIATYIIPKLITPPVTVYAVFELLKYLGHADVVPLSLRTRTGFTAVSFGLTVLYTVSKTWYHNLAQWRERRALGAEPIPVVKGKWPGNLDVLLEMMRDQDTNYAQQLFEDWSHEYGTLYNIRVLWDDMVRLSKDILG